MATQMDIDDKLGLSLDDLIKQRKQTQAPPKKPTSAPPKAGKPNKMKRKAPYSAEHRPKSFKQEHGFRRNRADNVPDQVFKKGSAARNKVFDQRRGIQTQGQRPSSSSHQRPSTANKPIQQRPHSAPKNKSNINVTIVNDNLKKVLPIETPAPVRPGPVSNHGLPPVAKNPTSLSARFSQIYTQPAGKADSAPKSTIIQPFHTNKPAGNTGIRKF